MEFIGAISNAIRGGQLDKYWRELPHDYINALAFALCAWYVTNNIWALALAPLMFLGASPGWGDYIGAMVGTRKENLTEAKFIDIFIRPLRRFPRVWGFLGLTLRGLFWGLCLSLGFMLIGEPNYHFLYLGALMGVVYIIGYVIGDMVEGNGWPVSEILFGAVLWSGL